MGANPKLAKTKFVDVEPGDVLMFVGQHGPRKWTFILRGQAVILYQPLDYNGECIFLIS